MNEPKTYFEQLLQKHKVSIEKHHARLLDVFVNDEFLAAAYNSIKNTQQAMLDKWKEKTQIEDLQAKQIVLANGTVNKPYNFVFDLEHLKLSNLIGSYKIEIDESIGISFNKEENKISGIPKEAGEHILLFQFKLKFETEEQPFHKKEITLIVNPDPKTLWISRPSNKDDKYWKEDNVSASAFIASKKLIIGSKRGRSHAQEGIFRDDDFDFGTFDDSGWSIVAVADGAGSSKFSRKGSQVACKEVIEYFRKMDKEKLKEIEETIADVLKEETKEKQKKLGGLFIEQLGKAAFAAQVRIREEATSNNAVIKDYSTTLIFALIKKYENKFMIASFWVGDGGIGIYTKEKHEIFVLGTPDSGEFAGQTRFLTMSDTFSDGAYANRVRFKIVDDFTSLVLMTDGITDPKFQTDANLNKIEKWNELWEDLNGNNQDNCKVDFTKPINESEKELMSWLDFWSPGNHDDRTIAILF